MPHQLAALFSVLLTAVLMSAAPVRAAELRAVIPDTAPYGFTRDGQPAGLAVELARALAAGAGCTVRLTMAPRASALRALNSGTADMTLLVGGPDTGHGLTNLGPAASSRFAVIGRSGTRLRTPGDLRGKTVATVRGAPEDPRLSTRGGVVVKPVADSTRCLKLLLAGQVDGAAGERLTLLQAAEALHLPPKALGDPLLLSPVPVDLVVSAGLDAILTARLTATLKRLTENGALQIIAGRYGL
jgi:ABC-type amino acid transport substrate-binding protein